jgi:hypothetical protein
LRITGKNILNDRIVYLFKIDVEGDELDFLSGFRQAINFTKVIQLEVVGCNINTRTYFQDFWYFFIENNFSLYRIALLGLSFLNSYSKMDKCFRTANYIAINKNLI